MNTMHGEIIKFIEADIQPTGIPMFDKSNSTDFVKNELDLIVRRVFIDKQISAEDFANKVKLYCDTLHNLTPGVVNNKKTNLTTTLNKGGLSFKKFKEVLCSILKLKLINIEFTFMEPCGKKYRVSLKTD